VSSSVISNRPEGHDSTEDAALGRRRRDLADWLIDEWGQQSFPASDPPGGVPPSLLPTPVAPVPAGRDRDPAIKGTPPHSSSPKPHVRLETGPHF